MDDITNDTLKSLWPMMPYHNMASVILVNIGPGNAVFGDKP